MAAYALRRFLLVIPTLLIVTIVLFLLVRLLPSGVVEQIAQNKEWTVQTMGAPQTDTDAIRKLLGLDQPSEYAKPWRWLLTVRLLLTATSKDTLECSNGRILTA